VEAVRHMREVNRGMRRLQMMDKEELMAEAKRLGAPFSIVEIVAQKGKLPVPNFAAGGVATPADASLMMQLGAEAVFVGSGIFKSDDPVARAEAIVKAVTYYNDPAVLLEVSKGLKDAMIGKPAKDLTEDEKLAKRGW
ncbi:MAG TPA: pyridoxal 5'-phosphate synthase lyase subunit PdxS, partial [Candidatus Marinimicrobia bacterium]|nr:pyridoxal 5'-phosphate synthase lyase subunit PdxS [Candidatus Neomarinimicrobiota bacterium]